MRRLSRRHTIPCGKRYNVFEPALIVEPGETVIVETINHMTPIVRSEGDLQPHGSPKYQEREETGPIAVRGARPGDMLAVHIENIEIVGLPHAHGSGPLVDRYPQEPLLFPVEDGRCRFPGALSVPVAPVIGDIYTTPLSPSPAYFDHGGNMDFSEVRPQNALYLPVYHEGGLLVLGDVHAVQGDGELFGEGAETAADVQIRIDIDNAYRSERPIVETPEALICLACRGGLFDGVRLAMEDMVRLLARLHSVAERDAYIFCSVAGSVRIGGNLSRRKLAEEWCLVGLSVPKNLM